jgi:nucleoside-diphosphate-sugar epimerase
MTFDDWIKAPDSRVAVTGATGWIGEALAHLCCDLGLTQDNGRLRLFGSSDRQVDSHGRTFHIEGLSDAAPLGDGRWLVFHFAFLGKEKTAELSASEFERVNEAVLADTKRLTSSAKDVRFVFASSGAVYTPDRGLVGPEGNPYGVMKVRHEQDIEAWTQARKIPTICARIFNIGGPYINKQALYALSDFIAQARNTGRIRIGAAKPVFRSFVHVTELCKVLFHVALKPDLTYTCFDTAGGEVVELGALAERVGRALDLDSVTIERPQIAPDSVGDWYVGDARFYQTERVKAGLVSCGLDDIIRETARYVASASA